MKAVQNVISRAWDAVLRFVCGVLPGVVICIILSPFILMYGLVVVVLALLQDGSNSGYFKRLKYKLKR